MGSAWEAVSGFAALAPRVAAPAPRLLPESNLRESSWFKVSGWDWSLCEVWLQLATLLEVFTGLDWVGQGSGWEEGAGSGVTELFLGLLLFFCAFSFVRSSSERKADPEPKSMTLTSLAPS